jgi:hypothetical protein
MAEASAATSPRIVPLDPRDPRTWVNIPAPDDTSEIQAELSRIGNLNKFGQPNFIIVWAQEYRTWDLGRMRIHFDDENIPAIHHPVRYAVRPGIYGQAAAWLETENKRRQQAAWNLDFTDYGELPDVGAWLKSNAGPDDYMLLPHDTDDLGRIARLLPDGWMYINAPHVFEHIGQHAYYVLQWYPPESFGDTRRWDELRFEKLYCPESDAEEFVDCLGPFPSEGSYENVVIRIATIDHYEDRHPVEIGRTIRREILRYRQPTVSYVADRLQEMIRLRDTLSDAEKDPVKRSAKRFKDFQDSAPERDMAWRKFFRERFNDAKPVGRGNPTNISSNKTKFDN